MITPEKRVVMKHTREPLPEITEEYIQDILRWITKRDIQILKLLRTYAYLTTKQIEMMAFSNLRPGSWRNKANERIRRLYKNHCIDRWFPPIKEQAGSMQQHVVLDEVGRLVLEKIEGSNEEIVNWKKTNDIPDHYKRVLKILDLRAMMYVLDRQLGVVNEHKKDEECFGEIVEWNMGEEAKVEYHDDTGSAVSFKPDAFGIYRIKPINHVFVGFFEIAERDTEEIMKKIHHYIQYFHSSEFKNAPWQSYLAGNQYPPVGFFFNDRRTLKKILKYILILKTDVRFLLTTFDKLTKETYKEYENVHGKKRRVLQEVRVRIMDPIFLSNQEIGYTTCGKAPKQ